MPGSTISSLSARRTDCPPISSAPTIIRPTPSGSPATIPRHSFRKAGAACCANRRARCASRPATCRSITRSGARLRIRAIRCTTSLMPPPSSSRPSWKRAAWSRVTAIGHSPTSSRRIIFPPCRFTAASACSTFTASPSPPIAPSNCCTRSEPKCLPVEGAHPTVDAWAVRGDAVRDRSAHQLRVAAPPDRHGDDPGKALPMRSLRSRPRSGASIRITPTRNGAGRKWALRNIWTPQPWRN